MTQTIHFNTNRQYTVNGQRITATLHDDHVVTFFDHDRMVHGEFDFPSARWRDLERGDVMDAYDQCQYTNSTRAWQDGMMPGGCNSKFLG